MKFKSVLMTIIVLLCAGTARAQQGVRIYGYLDLEYMYMGRMPMVMTMQDSMGMEMEQIGYMDKRSSFMAHRFNILLKSDFSETFSAFANLEILHGFNSEEGIGSMQLEEGWFQYAASEALNVKGGILLVNFGSFNKIHNASPTYWSVRTPVFFDEMYDIRLLPGQANLEFSGLTNLNGVNFDYSLHFSNGEGVDEEGMDLNSTSAVGGRIGVSPVEGFTLGFSGHFDKELEADDSGQGGMGGEDPVQIDANIFGVDASYEYSGFKVYGEYYHGQYNNDLLDFNKTGYFAVAGYTISGKLTPFVEYDFFDDPNDFLYRNEMTRVTFGVNYSVNWRVALKAEAHNHSFKRGNIDSYNMYQAAVSVLF